jgi:hypothetical protein
MGCTGGIRETWAFKDAFVDQSAPQYQTKLQHGPKEHQSMFEEMRAYVREYRSVLFTLVIVLIVDHLFLGGALRARVQASLSGLIDKAERTLGVGHDASKS